MPLPEPLISESILRAIRIRGQRLKHLPNGFYLYSTRSGRVHLIAQGPFDWSKLEILQHYIDMIAGELGVNLDFSVKLDKPHKQMLEGLYHTNLEIPHVVEDDEVVA